MIPVFKRIKEVLGKPSFENDRAIIYQGDCLDYMRQLQNMQFRLTITSPPYNIGKEYEKEVPTSAYLDWCEAWIHEVFRLTSMDGAFWLNLGYVNILGRARAIPIPYLLWERIPFFLLQEIVWHYEAGVACRRSFSPRNEKFLWYVKDPDRYVFNLDQVRDPNVKYPHQKKNGQLKCNPNGKNPGDVWRIPKVTSGENRSSKERMPHPAQFPVAVIDRIVQACSNPDDLILDPFIGSGTVGEVGILRGRNVVGFEIKPGYVEVAARRLERTASRHADDSRQHLLFSASQAG